MKLLEKENSSNICSLSVLKLRWWPLTERALYNDLLIKLLIDFGKVNEEVSKTASIKLVWFTCGVYHRS